MTSRYVSRLAKKQRSKNLRFAIFMSLLTCAVLALLVFAGLPLFIKVAGWWADMRASQTEVQPENTLPPPPPRIRLASDITNSSVIDISGFSQPGSTVNIYVNDQAIKEVTTESNGQFFATDFELKKGPNTIFALATNQSGAQSQPSDEEVVILDTELPELAIEQPQPGNEFRGPKQNRLEVIGTTEPRVRLWINDRLAQVDDKGRFVHSLTLTEGEQSIEVKAIDEAGNESIELINIKYTP